MRHRRIDKVVTIRRDNHIKDPRGCDYVEWSMADKCKVVKAIMVDSAVARATCGDVTAILHLDKGDLNSKGIITEACHLTPNCFTATVGIQNAAVVIFSRDLFTRYVKIRGIVDEELAIINTITRLLHN